MGAARDIVIYEEDHLTRTLLEEWLRGAGYRVRMGNRRDPVGDGQHCDLVIVSVYLPKQTGAECIRDIQSVHAGAPVIAISGHFRPRLAPSGSTAQMLCVRQVVAKPLMREELLESVRAILGE